MMYLTSDFMFVVLDFYFTNLSLEEENPCNMFVLSYKVLYYVPYEGYELSSVINICIWTLRYVQDMTMQVSLNHGKVKAIGIDAFSCWAQNYKIIKDLHLKIIQLGSNDENFTMKFGYLTKP